MPALGSPPSADAAWDVYYLAYCARLSLDDQHPCVQAAAADVHEGLDGLPAASNRMISPSRFTRAYDYRVAVWTSNPIGQQAIAARWPVHPLRQRADAPLRPWGLL